MQNIEFKAELRNVEAARRQCAIIDAACMGAMRQTDTYFKLADGRLKRRESISQSASSAIAPRVEWIFYHRPNRVSPRLSNFTILTDEQARRRWGTHSLREWVKVVKTRELWITGEVRIHLDDVQDLGTFIEFEAKVSRQFDVKQCHLTIAGLREGFAPVMGEPISASYSDLMEQLAADKVK